MKDKLKLSCIVFGIITYMQFPCILMVPSKKSLVALSRVRSLWKELTKILSVCGGGGEGGGEGGGKGGGEY